MSKQKPLFRDNESNKIQIFEPTVFTNLGDITHAVFDKSDTLTLNNIEIVELATCTKLYSIDTHGLYKKYKEVLKDPTKFQRIEDLEEVMKLKEDENYSEKSQEFHKEVKGEYDAHIFDEEPNHSDEELDTINNNMTKWSGSDIHSRNGSLLPSSIEKGFRPNLLPNLSKRDINMMKRPSRRAGLINLNEMKQDISKNVFDKQETAGRDLAMHSNMVKILSDISIKEKQFMQKI